MVMPKDIFKNENPEKGIVLLIAVVFMSVMLSFGLTLSALGFKQQQLTSSSLGSQSAFYVAGAALECALFADQQLNIFAYRLPILGSPLTTLGSLVCGSTASTVHVLMHAGDSTNPSLGLLKLSARVPLDNGTHCADVVIYKYEVAQANNITTRVLSQGYNVPCSVVDSPSGARFSSRGVSANY